MSATTLRRPCRQSANLMGFAPHTTFHCDSLIPPPHGHGRNPMRFALCRHGLLRVVALIYFLGCSSVSWGHGLLDQVNFPSSIGGYNCGYSSATGQAIPGANLGQSFIPSHGLLAAVSVPIGAGGTFDQPVPSTAT